MTAVSVERAFRQDAQKISFEKDVPHADKLPRKVKYQQACGAVCRSAAGKVLQAPLLAAWEKLVASQTGKIAKAPGGDLMLSHEVDFGGHQVTPIVCCCCDLRSALV